MMNDERFDHLLDSLRDEPVPSADAAKARVWEKLAATPAAPPVCGQFRADFPAYLSGSLLESRRLLLQDHLTRCAGCRKVLAEQSGKVVEMPKLRAANRFAGWSKWAVAAGVAALTIYAGRDRLDAAFAPSGARATVETVSGELRGPSGLLAVGAKLNEGDVVRTATGARAVLRLADGSALEMNQQAALAVHAAWSGQTVDLHSGDLIMQAAKQRRGRLRVRTRDSVASVKGTVFAVSTGIVGSLVAVVEGSVEVEQGTSRELLKPGQRAASSTSLSGVTASDAVSWSQNAQQYLALLADFSKIEQQVALAPQNIRREAKLVASLPPQSNLYGAVPNIGSSLSRAVEDQLRQSATLRTWWESKQGLEFKRLLDTMNTITPHLGDEVVFVLSGPPNGTVVPVVLAEVKTGQQAMLQQGMARLAASDFAFRVTDKLLVISENAARLNAVLPTLGQGANTSFAAEIRRRYQRGAGWMMAFNLEAVTGSVPDAAALGIDGARHAFFEQRADNGTDQNEAAVTFAGARRGVASWLGAPAAAASAEYITSDAVMAFSGVSKNPRQAFDEFVTMVGRLQPGFLTGLRQFETESGIRVADDLASAFGTDFSFAIETPTVPVPGWLFAAEVLRAGSLDASMRRLVDLHNKSAKEVDRLVLAQESAGGRQWNTLKGGSLTLYWTYDRGYLVASTDRAVASRALSTRNGGFPLVRSAKFRERLPLASSVHQSGFVWLNASQVLTQLAAFAPPAIKSLLENRNPVLVVVNGEADRIVALSKTRLTSLILDLGMAAMQQGPGPKAKAKKLVAEEEDEDEQ